MVSMLCWNSMNYIAYCQVPKNGSKSIIYTNVTHFFLHVYNYLQSYEYIDDFRKTCFMSCNLMEFDTHT